MISSLYAPRIVPWASHLASFPTLLLLVFFSPSCGIVFQRINYCHLTLSLTHYFQIVLLFFFSSYTQSCGHYWNDASNSRVSRPPSAQSRTLKAKSLNSFYPLLHFVSWKDVPLFYMFPVKIFPSFPLTDLIFYNFSIFFASVLTIRFPHKMLPALWTDYAFPYSSHSLACPSSQMVGNYHYPYQKMGWGRNRQTLSCREGSRYHSSCLPAVVQVQTWHHLPAPAPSLQL